MLFTRQLATMVDAGLPLVTALTGFYEQSDPKRQAGLRYVIGDLSARVQQGDIIFRGRLQTPKGFQPALRQHGKSGRIRRIVAGNPGPACRVPGGHPQGSGRR